MTRRLNLTVALSALVLAGVLPAGRQAYAEPAPPPPPAAAPWDVAKLRKVPAYEVTATTKQDKGEVKELWFKGPASPTSTAGYTKVFAYYGRPAGPAGTKYPCLVLIHGWAGQAMAGWVREAVNRGYAAIALSTNGRLGDNSKDAWPDDVRGPGDGYSGQGDAKGVSPFADRTGEPHSAIWMYHAVADVILANSLVRSFPEVDAEHVGVWGISWGGYHACIVAGLDDRFAGAVPQYGCGFLADNGAWAKDFASMKNTAWRDEWVRTWDPSNYVGNTKVPMFFLNGDADSFYPLDSWMRTYDLVRSPKNLCAQRGFGHGHFWDKRAEPAWRFLDERLKGGPPVPVVSRPSVAAGKVVANVKGLSKVERPTLCYTTGPATSNAKREWVAVPLTAGPDGALSGQAPPAEATAYYVSVSDTAETKSYKSIVTSAAVIAEPAVAASPTPRSAARPLTAPPPVTVPTPPRAKAAPDDRECVISNGLTDAENGARAMRKPGEAIAIRAKPPATDMRFDKWVGNVEFLKDPKAPETTLTMPPAGYPFNHVHVSAAYRSALPKPFLHPLFRDHMVLQRDVPAAVWGWAEPGVEVAVEVAGSTVKATAGTDGRWLARVGPLKAGGPFELKVTGPQAVVVKDVLVGDVWLCSGQSNMRGQGVAAEDAASADYPRMRLLSLNPSAESYDGADPFETIEGYKADWQPCTPAVAKNFSRTAFYFGEALHKQHDVPVGLVVCSYDGSSIEAWMPQPTLASLPEMKTEEGMFRPNWNLSWGGGATPFIRFNAHIAPLAPFAFRGVLWYQGESNANERTSVRYRDLLTLMIRDWRKVFGNDDLPFVLIQLHGFGKLDTNRPPGGRRETWVELQESQLTVARSVPKVVCAVTVDLAKEQSLHPPDKKAIGRRAAQVARSAAYGEDVPAYGPLYKGMTIDGEAARLTFEHAEGLTSRDGRPLRYFAIAGEDRKFEWAEAKVVGEAVMVSSPKVKKPASVRYAWGSAQQESNLTNQHGLPAPAFRTDAWEDQK